jgi:hypothetical protein
MRGIHYKGMTGKSNVIKRNVEKVWGARYLSKNTVLNICMIHTVVLLQYSGGCSRVTQHINISPTQCSSVLLICFLCRPEDG